jgi:L-ascorbate metabolism protein UlaG (beta-lactamase superfamily)
MKGRLRALALVFAGLVGGCGSLYQGPASDHFDGRVFFNPGVQKSSTPIGYLWRRLTDPPAAWPESVPLPAGVPPPVQRVHDGSARITYVGHATLLIQVAGLNILTDPLWSERASPLSWIGPRRVTPPAWPLQALPPIDLVLISHDHHDHLDPATLAALAARDRPRVIVPLGLQRRVAEAMPGSVVSEHDWGARVALPAASGSASAGPSAGSSPGAVIHVEPMRHGSGRGPFDQMQTLWAAYVIEVGGFKIWHVGDSGYGDFARATAARHGALDLAILPIGAWEPVDFMADSHMSPAQAVQLLQDSGAARGLAHHFDTFALGFEAHGAAPTALAAARQATGMEAERFVVPVPGQVLTLAQPRAPRAQ